MQTDLTIELCIELYSRFKITTTVDADRRVIIHDTEQFTITTI